MKILTILVEGCLLSILLATVVKIVQNKEKGEIEK